MSEGKQVGAVKVIYYLSGHEYGHFTRSVTAMLSWAWSAKDTSGRSQYR